MSRGYWSGNHFSSCYHNRHEEPSGQRDKIQGEVPLALLDEIGHTGGTITVTKRGRPMAKVGPVRKRLPSSEDLWKGKVHIPEEVLTADLSDQWEVLRQK